MADRQTKVTLRANVSNYLAGMEAVAKKTREVGTASEKLAAQREAFGELGQASLAMGAAASVGVGLAVSKFADFDQAMSNVAATGDDARGSIDALREAALDAGARTVYSATEAANAIEELAKAGVSAEDILSGGLDGALDLAAAGGLGVADAAGIAATALKTFKLEGEDMAHVADLLAAGAGKAMGDVTDLSQALNQSALVANSTGLSIEETTAALAAFASQGLKGSDAGTSFKTMLGALTPNSEKAAKEMERLGISAYDAQGNFVGLESFAGNLKTSLAGLTDEQRNASLEIMFGSDAVRAATVLYDEGSEGISEWTENVNDSGYAAETAATRLDNLKGDVEALGGALDTALIKTGSTANDTLRFMTQTTTGLVEAYNDLPKPVQGAVLALSGVVSVAGLAGGAFFYAVPKVADFNKALDTMGPRAQKAGRALRGTASFLSGPWGAALAAATVAVGLIISAQAQHKATVDELTESLDKQTGAYTENTRAAVAKKLQDSGAFEIAKRLGLSLDTVTDAAMGNAEAYAEVKNASNEAYAGMSTWETFFSQWSLDPLINNVDALNGGLVESKNAWANQGDAMSEAERQADDNATAIAQLEGASVSTKDAVDDLSDTIRNFGSAELDVRSATRDVEAAFDDLQASIEDNGTTLDVTTEAGRANEAAIDAMASSALELAAATYDQTGSMKDANDVIATQRTRLMDTLTAMGMSKDEAGRYIDKLGLIPGNVYTAAVVNTEDASAELQSFINTYDGRRINMYVDTYGGKKYQVRSNTGQNTDVYYNADGGLYSYASGGFGSGIYSGGTPLYKFAEPETRWEAFISGKRGEEQRNIGIAYDALARLGALPQPQVVTVGGGEGRTVNVTQNIYAQPGMSPQEVATIANRKLNDALK